MNGLYGSNRDPRRGYFFLGCGQSGRGECVETTSKHRIL